MGVVRVPHYHELHHPASRLKQLHSFVVGEVFQRSPINVRDLVIHSQLSVSVAKRLVCAYEGKEAKWERHTCQVRNMMAALYSHIGTTSAT